jgi:hypothetical protein
MCLETTPTVLIRSGEEANTLNGKYAASCLIRTERRSDERVRLGASNGYTRVVRGTGPSFVLLGTA